MPKTRDIPTELREFNSIFEELARHNEYSRVFEDFLDWTMLNFSFVSDKKLAIAIKERYNEKNGMELMNKLFVSFIMTMEKMLNDKRTWYDLLGTFYEVLASSGKRSSFGQFFTPPAVVDLMVQMQYAKDMRGKKINDPTCGSGRLLIAFHAHCPGNYVFGEDLDGMCAKMSAINMCIHGAVGEIVHHNSLLMDSFFNGWAVNATLNQTGMPSIKKITQEESLIMKITNRPSTANSSASTSGAKTPPPPDSQLSFFNE